MLIVKGSSGKSGFIINYIVGRSIGNLIITNTELNHYNMEDNLELIVDNYFNYSHVKELLEDNNVIDNYSTVVLNLNIKEADLFEYLAVVEKFRFNVDSYIEFIITVKGDNNKLEVWQEFL